LTLSLNKNKKLKATNFLDEVCKISTTAFRHWNTSFYNSVAINELRNFGFEKIKLVLDVNPSATSIHRSLFKSREKRFPHCFPSLTMVNKRQLKFQRAGSGAQKRDDLSAHNEGDNDSN